jgi:hypothetical protein
LNVTSEEVHIRIEISTGIKGKNQESKSIRGLLVIAEMIVKILQSYLFWGLESRFFVIHILVVSRMDH